jgi:glycine oxidase
MSESTADVVIVGGGLAGIATAYYLGKQGVHSTVIERDAVGSHASGFAYGGLGALDGIEVHGPTQAIATASMRLHRDLAVSLPEDTGINTEFRERPGIALCYTDDEVRTAKANLVLREKQPEYECSWLGRDELLAMEPRISPDAIGAAYAEGTVDLEPYRFILAMAQAAEGLGTTIRHGTVTGIKRQGGRVTGVVLGDEEISCDAVVIAMGPWSGFASKWLDIPIDVTPLKGQILRLRAPGAPYRYSVGWDGHYATTKPDGLVWAGTTEEEVGFDEQTTVPARDMIMGELLRMLPSLADASLVQQTACLRPVASDKLMVLGRAPGWEGIYLATGGARSGIILGPAIGQITAGLVATGESPLPIDAFDAARFAA